MGGSRSRASRRRPLHSKSQTSIDLLAISHQLQNDLRGTTAHPQLLSLLSNISAPPPPSFQVELGAALHLHILQCPPASPYIRFRLAQLCSSLPHWHASSPSASLSTAEALATSSLSPTSSRDASALSASLSCVAAIARAALPSRPAREQVERHVPSLVEPIHVALFTSRPAPLADPNSDSGSGAQSDRDGLSSYAPRLHTVRYAALNALQSLAGVASRALIPFWGMFLPDRDGVPRRAAGGRDTLASIILFERDVQLRSTAVSTVTALLASTRTFIQKATQFARPTNPQTSVSFTSASSRVLRASAALYTVVASALESESSGVVTAKLAKLGAELAWSMPVPAVPHEKAVLLAQALRSRLLDEENTDLTSRAAAASAIAVLVAKSGENIALDEIEQFCEDFIGVLRNRHGNQPALEILTVLRNIVFVHPHLFRRMLHGWHLPLIDLEREEPATGQSLHCIRIAETYISQTVKLLQGKPRRAGDGNEIDDVRVEVSLAWELYHTLLHRVVQDRTHPGQGSAINALGSVLLLSDIVSPLANQKHVAASSCEASCFENRHSTTVQNAVGLLKGVAVSNQSDTTRIGSIKSLACVPVRKVSIDVLSEIVGCLDDEMRSLCNAPSVRGKAMSSFVSLMERILRELPQQNDFFFSRLDSASEFAAQYLKLGQGKEIQRNMRTNRSGAESSDIAAINLVVCALQESSTSNLRLSNLKVSVSQHQWSSRWCEQALVLSNVLKGEKPVNTKCMCCRAVGKILMSIVSGCSEALTKLREILTEAVRWSLENGELRMQLVSAIVLLDLLPARTAPTYFLDSTIWNVSLFEKASARYKSEDMDTKERLHLTAIQDTLAETICQSLQRCDYEMMGKLSEKWKGDQVEELHLKKLREAVFRHLSLPLTVTRHMSMTADGQVTSEHQNAKSFLDTLSEDSLLIVRKVLTVQKLLADD